MCDRVFSGGGNFQTFPFSDFFSAVPSSIFPQSQPVKMQLLLLAADRRTLHVHVHYGCRCEQFFFPPSEYTKETQGRIAKKEKTMRLNIGSGSRWALRAEEETPGRFGWTMMSSLSPSVSVSWGDRNSRVGREVREGSPTLPNWAEGSGFPDLCYIHACQGEALLKVNDRTPKT